MATECCSMDNRQSEEWAKLTKLLDKVTPGSVAQNGLDPGDLILKIGSVNATNITLNEAQEVIKGASNLLQLTIKKGAVAPSPLTPQAAPSQYSSPPEPSYGSSPYEQEQPKYSFPDYRVGSGYHDYNGANSGGHKTYAVGNSPYDMRMQEQAPSGYSTLPARSGNKQSNESFRPVNDPQAKYPYKATAGIQLKINPQGQSRDVQRAQDDADIYNQQRSSPIQYPGSPQDSQYQRQLSGGSNRSDTNSQPQSYFKKPTPFSPTYNGSADPAPQLQRQTSSGSQGKAFVATLSQPSHQQNNHSPGSDEGPPPPPPPVNYRQPEPYQRQSSQPGAYNSSPYDQRQNSNDPYQQQPPQQPGMYVDTTDQPQYQRQGSRPQEYSAPPQPYQPQQSQPGYYNDRPSQPPAPPPAPYQRQPSYGSQPQTPQQQPYGSPYTPPPQTPQQQPPYGSQPQTPQQQPPYGSQPQTPQQQYGSPYTPQQTYNRQSSRDQPVYPVSPPGGTGTGINSFEDILQPFEKFQNSNYCDKLFSRDNRGDVDSGVASDFSQSFSSDTPRSTQSNYSNYSPPHPGYPQQQQNLLQPAAAGPPPPAVSPPPPPPPPPPSDWQATPRRPPPTAERSTNGGGEGQMPDKVLNTMLKNAGTQKPFAYVPTGMDLKKFKERARQRQQRPVMPRGYEGPPVEADDDSAENKKIGGVPNPDTGVYKHAQYNSPLKMYSSDNARDAFNVQSGGNTDVTPGANGTPERRTSDIKDSEVYKMIKDQDAKGYKPKKPRNPLLRHNSEDDEMRFSGLHTKADIPSKAFSRLNKLVISDDNQSTEGQQNNQQPDDAAGRTATDDDEDDGLPDKLSEEDMVDKRYQGSNIPSKSFKALQMFTDSGDEAKKAAGGVGGGPKIKVINRAAMSPATTSDSGTATPPRRTDTPSDNPVSDF